MDKVTNCLSASTRRAIYLVPMVVLHTGTLKKMSGGKSFFSNRTGISKSTTQDRSLPVTLLCKVGQGAPSGNMYDKNVTLLVR